MPPLTLCANFTFLKILFARKHKRKVSASSLKQCLLSVNVSSQIMIDRAENFRKLLLSLYENLHVPKA